MSDLIKVYGYVRVSTEEQATKGLSIGDQVANITDYCTKKKLNLVDLYIDKGVSGSIPPNDRPEMKLLLDNLDKGLACGLVACKLDRISRSLKDFLSFVDSFNDKQYQFFLLYPDVDTHTSQGLFQLHIMASVAQLERGMTIERVKTTIAGKRSRNELLGSIPFGKRLIVNSDLKAPKRLEDDPDELKTIDIIMKERKIIIGQFKNKNKGKPKFKTYASICKELIELGRKNKNGNIKWSPAQIKRIVENSLNNNKL